MSLFIRVIFIFLSVLSAVNGYACSCWDKFLSKEEKSKYQYFIASAGTTNEYADFSITSFKVLDPLNSGLDNGGVVGVKQEYNFCFLKIEDGAPYKIKYSKQDVYIRGSICSVKKYTEGDE